MAAMVAAPNPHDPPDSGNLGVTANIKPTHAPASSAPPPVIPTSLLSVDEQRRLILWAVGLIEVMKLWDVLAPHFAADLPASLSSAARVRGPWSAGLWAGGELAAVAAIALLRIPGLSPSSGRIVALVPLLVVWNTICWFLAEPLAFVPKVSMFGPVHLGEEGIFWGWLYLVRHIASRLLFGEPEHIEGIHKIRLLPYSTATLNPLSLTYCLPPGSREPIFVPVVFNNSAPDQVVYHVRSLVDQHAEVLTVPAALMKRPVGWQVPVTDEDTEDTPEESLSEIIARSKQLDLARFHSVRPAESLSIIPPDLSTSESLLFITVTQPSVIALSSVSDKHGDRFHVAPHREAVVIECPTGGEFVTEEKGKMSVVPHKRVPEIRCVGGEEVANFQVRGVAPLKVGWRRSVDGKVVAQGVVEGIDEDALQDAESLKRDRVSKTHTVPLRVTHDRAGKVAVTLTSVVDALGNSYSPPSASAVLEYHVLEHRSVSFTCPRPIQLLVNGTAKLPVHVDGPLAYPLDLTYAFTSTAGAVKTHTMSVDKTDTSLQVNEPGTFSLVDVQGRCPGTILEPASCNVQLVPVPSVELSVTTLHECAMDVGVTVTFEFTGAPPYTVLLAEGRQGSPKKPARRVHFNTPGGQMEFRPEQEGTYSYSFLALSDAHYRDVPLNQPPVVQVVHPPASVDITGVSQRSLYACSGDNVDLDLAIEGNDPLKLTYRTSWGGDSYNVTVPVKSGKQRLTVPVPESLRADSGAAGKLSIALVHIEDSNGCVKRLPGRVVDVDINRHRATARLARYETVVVKEGDSVDVPLRLTGKGPWEVAYSLNGKAHDKVQVHQANSQLRFAARGSYQLTSVRDTHCPGTVDDKVYAIDFKPRPSASLVETTTVKRDGTQYRHVGMCAGEDDAVAVQFTGTSPFEVTYKYELVGVGARDHAVKSAQNVGILQLSPEPGTHYYRFTSVRDANYDRTPVSFTLENTVHGRPSATFARTNTVSLCRDSPLDTDAKVRLTGAAPFELTVGVRRPASAEVVPHKIKVHGHEWSVSLPSEVLSDVGRWEVTLMSVSDSSGCDYVVADDDVLSTTVDVVETAKVVPVSHDDDLCVGDTLDFLLQGKAPWIVEYAWNSKVYTVTSSAASFSRGAESPGTFEIKSVALKDRFGNAQCQRAVAIERRVHPLPSVRIQDGIDSLREGDQPAVFDVHFTGTAPFTFSYTRSEWVNGRSRVVETQTVTDIWADHYAISSSAPGDYAVTSIADKYCRYPALGKRADV